MESAKNKEVSTICMGLLLSVFVNLRVSLSLGHAYSLF